MSGSTAIANPWRLDNEQIELIKTAIARGATDNELALFIQTCNRLQLDPFARQIFLVKRWDSKLKREVATTQVSIDGFRLIAERTGQYRGQTQPQWCGAELDAEGNARWVTAWLADGPPAAARIGVHRSGFIEPLYRIARWSGYAQYNQGGHLNPVWAQYGENMLLKCAEALALRAAFPHELSGIYTDDELPADGARYEVAPMRPPVKVERAAPTVALHDGRTLPKTDGAPRTIDDFMKMQVRPRPEPVVVAEPVIKDAEVIYDEETGEVDGFEEGELPVPAAPAQAPNKVRHLPSQKPGGNEPVWSSGQYKGKRYTDTPRAYLRFMLAGSWAKSASSHQLAWARYALVWRTEQARAEGRE